ncbi:protein Shroom2 isoform X2 [Hippocampus zosterae]|uniref:protein Shroom2 isoform X2 n=2 Tax=Hippocampus zosterae TaxID=109293 RepID=UPI00223DC325|nr:protein Shroom2 isoform X2 [Hippocampus zosterae]
MDSEQYKVDVHYMDGGNGSSHHWDLIAKAGDSDSRARDGDGGGWRLLEVSLSGGAPWGFTLRGGLEHREPLLITKVEAASKAAAVGLQAGDELVNINEIPLSGFRQEAICLVKGSHRTLSLMVKRNVKMVDIVAQKMPSENDVHVARSFLTKILRSSMRRTEPISRPHSWHSTKFNEGQSESAKTQSSPPSAVAWHATYDATSSSTDLSSSWEQTNLCRVSDQFSSLGSMDSLEHVPHTYPAGQLSLAKSNNSMEHLGGGGSGKRDSAYSSFSTSSGTPDFTLSKSNAASTENVLYKVSQWDAGGRPVNGRSGQSLIEGVKQDDRLTYFQMPGGCDAPQADDQAGSLHSTSGRTSCGPVWYVPDKKTSSSPSPPPPLPPARSDSFAATKERCLVAAHPEAPNSRTPGKPSAEDRSGQNLSPKHDRAGFYSHVQFNSNKQHSLSTCDVRQGHPAHHKHHGDKSTFPAQPWPATAPKPLNVGGYFSSMQELPTNGSAQPASLNTRRNLSTSQAFAPKDPNIESTGQSRHYCVTKSQPTLGKPEDRQSLASLNSTQTGNEQNSQQGVTKAKYSPQQQYSSNSRETNGYGKQHVTSAVETSPPKAIADDLRSQRGQSSQNEEAPYPSCPPIRLSNQRRSLPLHHREFPQDRRHHSQASDKICPQATPILHSLATDTKDEIPKAFDPEETVESKQMRRNERFATTLKNEIQMRRANLQKSKSAATLPDENQDHQDVWKSNQSSTPALADSPFTNTYKDNLKEAQARVLKATSFRRKDLEPIVVEHSSADAIPSYPSSAMARKDLTPLPTLSEVGTNKSAPLRIGGRKRFGVEKKVKSFSEPDKIHEVGVKEEESTTSFPDQRNEKSTVPGHTSPNTEISIDPTVRIFPSETEPMPKGTMSGDDAPGGPTYSVLDQKRLGTFAEYEARWNTQKKPPETRASGRFRSADNILDSSSKESVKPACFHERSRSSPSAEFYGQTSHGPAIMPEQEYSQMEDKPAGPLNSASSFQEDCKVREKPAERERAPPATGHTTSTAASAAESARSQATEHAEPPPPRCPDINPDEATLPPSHTQNSVAKKTAGKVQVGAVARHTPAHTPSDRTPAAMEARRSPSPHFSPQRLSDKPPVSLQDQDSNGMENGTEKPCSAVKKVPVRIVRSQGMPETENGRTFPRPDEASAAGTGGPDISKLGRLGASGQDSVFCTFTRQKELDEPGVTSDQPERDAATPTMSEEQKREELARDIMDKDKSLADILDQSKMKTTMDLMEGLFPQGEQLLEGAHQRKKAPAKPPNATRQAEEREKEDSMAAAVALVTSSAYYSTSAPKAELLIKMKDMQEQNEDYDDSEDELDMDLANKKQELMDSLSKKLQVLREARQSLQEDVLDNNALGDEVEARVQQVCKPNELDKFRMFVGDLDKVVSLLLSLSGRLARVENALNSLDEEATPEERRTLTEKRKLLIRQHEDAKELKDNLDRRERAVYDILASYLPEDGMADYEHFVKMKSALIIEQRKLEDKIKLGEEQLKCLLDSLPIEQRLAF